MQRTHLVSLFFGLCALTVAAGFIYFSDAFSEQSDKDSAVIDGGIFVVSETAPAPTPDSPFAVVDPVDSVAATDNDPVGTITRRPPQADRTPTITIDISANVDVTAIGRSPIGDAEFERLVAQLRNNPELLQQLIDEFRQETDADRQLQLLRLLGETGGPSVTLTASELIYSGNPESRRIGLELLQMVQPGNAEAREIASSLLATSVEPDVLVSTLTTLARPGDVSDENREFLAQQVAILAAHKDESVRSISLSILSRWGNDEQFTAVFLDGLNDSVDIVRESAAYSLVGHGDASPAVISALMAVATDNTEYEQARRGSILALRGMGISSQLQALLDRTERELNTRKR